jgi:hypothetical protein
LGQEHWGASRRGDQHRTPCWGDLAATLFWRFSLDPTLEIRDLTGRSDRLVEGEPLRKLFA